MINLKKAACDWQVLGVERQMFFLKEKGSSREIQEKSEDALIKIQLIVDNNS